MVSTVGTRPNHYELLGLTSKATGEEIAQAFARGISMFRPHSFGGLAALSIAYETLRDPGRRRAYDASIGLAPEPKQPAVPQGWQFVASMRAVPVARPSNDPLHRPAARVEPQPQPQPQPQPESEPRPQSAADQRVAAIVASLRELAKPAPEPSPVPAAEPEQRQPAEPERDVGLEPVIDHILAVGHAERESLNNEGRPVEWRRPALIAGGLILGVGLLGAWAGTTAGNDIEASQPERALTVPLPQAKETSANIVESAPPAWVAAEPRPERATRPVPARRIERTQPAQQSGTAEDRMVEVAQALETAPDDATGEQRAPEAPAATVTPAKLPLPNAVIARTIGRIGYPCGQVASAATVEGDAPGVFTVTCTSGHSYRAAPVRGRYHFRRLARR